MTEGSAEAGAAQKDREAREGRERRFGRYVLARPLARGGMGQVFLAIRPGPHGVARPCVLKLIRPEFAADQELVRRFIEEARVLVSLSHRNIVQMYEFGQVGAEYFMAMEYVEGVSLATLLREGGPMPVDLSLLVAREMLSALGCAHTHVDGSGRAAEIVHRDVSPSNVLVSLAGDVKLVDFGLALSRERDRLTLPGLVVGTREYQAPEVIRLQPATPRSDLYSVGACLYQMLTGLRPSEVRQSAGGDQGTGFLPPPSRHRGDVPARLDEICLQALQRDPAQRQPTAEAMRREVQILLATLAPAIDGDALAALVTERAASLVPRAASWQRGDLAALASLSEASGPAGGSGLPERSLAVSPHLGNTGVVQGSRSSGPFRGREIVTGVLQLDLVPLGPGEDGPSSDRGTAVRTGRRADDTAQTDSLRNEWEDRTWVDGDALGSGAPGTSGGFADPMSLAAFVMPVSSNPGVSGRGPGGGPPAVGPDSSARPPSSGRIAARRWSSPPSSSRRRRVSPPTPPAPPTWLWVILMACALVLGGALASPSVRAALRALLG